MDAQVSVNYVCQRCQLPILLDEGFSRLSEHAIAELSLPLFSGTEMDFQGMSLDKVILPLLQDSKSNSHGFTLVGDTSDSEKSQPSKVVTKLFDIINSQGNVDYPLCEECTDHLIEMLDKQCVVELGQVNAYEELIHSIRHMECDDTEQLEEELEKLKLEEISLIDELDKLEKEEDDAKKILEECQQEKETLVEEENTFWKEYCKYKSQLNTQEEEYRSVKNLRNHVQHQIDSLSQNNIFNTTFHIWHKGHFACINNLRLGRLPTVPVGWPEINAAWGQTVLLLHSLVTKTGVSFSKYKLVPFGNTSYIEVIGENRELPLYGCGGIKFLWDHKFDAGMAAFLECVAEFHHYIEMKGNQRAKEEGSKRLCRLPYKIVKHCLEDSPNKAQYSIKMQFNSEEQWTKALKYLLTNLKWILAFVSSSNFPYNK